MKIGTIQKQVRAKRERRVTGVRRVLLERRQFPRLTVHRSNNFVYAQIIDDTKRVTLVSVSDRELKEKMTKVQRAAYVGKKLAEVAVKKKITGVVFDRGWYKFHGRIKALADAARANGLQF